MDLGTVLINLAAERYDAQGFVAAQAHIILRNTEITQKVYDFCVQKGVNEVRSAGSSAVYAADETNFDDGIPVDLNSDPQDSELMYGWSKRFAEIYARLFKTKCGINTITFRLTNPYGPYDSLYEHKAHVIPSFVIRALKTTGPFTIRGNPKASRDFIYAHDVCEVIARSLRIRGRQEVYNLGSGECLTIERLAQTILRLVGRELNTESADAAMGGVVARGCRNERVRADFGIQFTTLEQGLTSTIRWYRDVLR